MRRFAPQRIIFHWEGSNYAAAYLNRGLAKYNLGDKQGGLEDLHNTRQSAELSRKQATELLRGEQLEFHLMVIDMQINRIQMDIDLMQRLKIN